jgi:hypothetical protein
MGKEVVMALTKKFRDEKKEIILACQQGRKELERLEELEEPSQMLMKCIKAGMDKWRERAWEIDLLG